MAGVTPMLPVLACANKAARSCFCSTKARKAEASGADRGCGPGRRRSPSHLGDSPLCCKCSRVSLSGALPLPVPGLPIPELETRGAGTRRCSPGRSDSQSIERAAKSRKCSWAQTKPTDRHVKWVQPVLLSREAVCTS